MANQEHVAKLMEGVEAWNAWRVADIGIIPDLSGANLAGAYLHQAVLTEANLTEANLRQANLRKANLEKANLVGAKLRGAYLDKAKLCDAVLTDADLTKASLRLADLTRANLSGAELRRAYLRRATFYETNLTRVNLTNADICRAMLPGADLSGLDLTKANLSGADLSGANLSGANLSRVSLVETDLKDANLTGCRIYGISAWDIKLNENTKERNLVITREGKPPITVDNLEVAQFIYLLLEHKKLRDVLNSVTQKGVLLLGRFGDGGLELLHAIANKLRELKYLPIIFDFDRPDKRDYTETVITLVGLSRFVIVELSGPSVPQELYSTVPHFDIPFVPILEKGSKDYSMFRDLLKHPWVLRPIVEYGDTENLLELLPAKVIEPAEEKAKARQEQLSQLFNR